MIETDRKMATVRKIDAILPIDGADKIELAKVGGWQAVVNRGEFKSGDLAIYCEIDSFVPHEIAPFLSMGREPMLVNGVRGRVVKTTKIRKVISQGLILPLSLCGSTSAQEGADVSGGLGVFKYEEPVPPELAGDVRGRLPGFIHRRKPQRVQNIEEEVARAIEEGLYFEVTEKLEGSTMTAYLSDGVFGVCSAKFDLEEKEKCPFWRAARQSGLEEKLRELSVNGGRYSNIALHGELIGPKIQGNIYGLVDHEFHVFNAYDISKSVFLGPLECRRLARRIGISYAPLLYVGELAEYPDLGAPDGYSNLNPNQLREGLVYKQLDGNMVFKSVSQKYLMENLK
jgi:RNA ligase (TIGR02306 family)